MQVIANYLMLMLTVIGVGLSIVVAGVCSIGLYEGASLIWHPGSRQGAKIQR
jgi:hypothetical protein